MKAVGDDDGRLDISELKMAAKLAQILDFDEEGDGFIGCDEAKEALERFGEELTDKAVNAVMEACDVDGDGQLSLTEFRKAVDMSRYMSGVDTEGTGEVNESDVQDFLSQHLPSPGATEEQVAKVMAKADSDGDGRLSYAEFEAVRAKWFVWLGLGAKPLSAKTQKTLMSLDDASKDQKKKTKTQLLAPLAE